MQIIVVAVLFADEIIHIAEPFRRGYRAAELGRQREHQIDERSGEGREVLWCVTGAADGGVAVQQKRIQRDRGAIGLPDNRRFIVAVNLVLLQLTQMASHFYEYRDASDRSAYLTMMNAFHALLYPYEKVKEQLRQALDSRGLL